VEGVVESGVLVEREVERDGLPVDDVPDVVGDELDEGLGDERRE
jgi:hypothetical protein